MASPPSPGADNAAAKVAKDRNCPFCGQAFTSSSLGRHLDLYIKSKNPKPPDGIHDVDEIRKMRGNITRRQSRVASGVKRDSLTSGGPTPTRYSAYDEKGTPTPNLLGKPGWAVNRPTWEATGVINDLPPRIEPRPLADRRDSSRREQLKVDFEQRQKIADELDTGKAAQLALREILDTVRNAEASATGRHLFDDFDFFQQNFASLCLHLLSPTPPLDSSLSISASDCWSSHIPWDQQRDALCRVVEERGQLLRRRSSLSTSSEAEASSAAGSLNLERFHRHIEHAFEFWKNQPEHLRAEAWQREIIRSYMRMEKELKEARNTIKTLKRETEFLARRLEKASSAAYTPTLTDRQISQSVPASPMGFSDDILRDLSRQGVNVREWDYERLLDRWKTVVRDERRASSGLSAQRTFSTSSQHARVIAASTGANLSVNGADSTAASRSASITSAMSATAPTRTSSMDSAALDADAEGEDEDMDDSIAPDAHPPYNPSSNPNTKPQSLPPPPPQPPAPQDPSATTPQPPQRQQPPPQHHDVRLPGIFPHHSQAHVDQNYKWPPPLPPPHQPSSTTPTLYTHLPDPGTTRRMAPGPDSWHTEFHHVVAHSMEGVQGPPATAGAAPASAG